MNITKRLIGQCFKKGEKASLDFEALIRRLLLFDTYILETNRFNEIPHLVDYFGLDGLLKILKSGSLKIYLRTYTMGQTGQTSILKSRKDKGVLPKGSFSFSIIKPSHPNYNIVSAFNEQSFPQLSFKQKMKLLESILPSLEEDPEKAGTKTVDQLNKDMRENSPIIKRLIDKILFDKYGIKDKEREFSLRLIQINKDDFKSETNLGNIYGFNSEEVHKIIEKTLLSLSGLNQRIELMENHNALTGFDDDELSILETKFDLLIKSFLHSFSS